MANLCSNDITVTCEPGDEGDLKAFVEALKKPPKELSENIVCRNAEALSSDYGHYNVTEVPPTKVTLYVCSKWSPPTEEVIALSGLFPTLTIKVVYDEPGNEIYGCQSFTQGCCVEDRVMAEKTWRAEYDEDYIEEKLHIAECPYEEFLKEYGDWDIYDEPRYSTLGADIVARIKEKDLPLFMGVDWGDEETEQAYKDRFK